jgi:hypothetical protein
LADLLAKAGIGSPHDIAREVWLLSEGAISLMLVHGDRTYAAAAARAAKRLPIYTKRSWSSPARRA